MGFSKHVVLVVGAALFAAVALSSSASADSSPPSVAITAPTAGSTVKGTIAVTASVQANGGDDIDYVDFDDGANGIGEADCGGEPTCTASIQWDTTGLTGQHTLTATAETNDGFESTSSAVSITIVSPAPTVEITSPKQGATVARKTEIDVTAATDTSQSDYPTYLDIDDGVNGIGEIDCQGQQTCQGSVDWDATGLSGPHTLTATVQTNRGVSATSPGISVKVVSPGPTVKILSPRAGATLHPHMTIRVWGATSPSQTDYPTSIDVSDGQDGIGEIDCQGQRVCEGSVQWDTQGVRGGQTLRATISTNRGLSATSRPLRVGAVVKRTVEASCTLSTSVANVGQTVFGHCSLPAVPAGTAVAILYGSAGALSTAVSGQVEAAGKFAFKLRGSRKTTFNLWVQVATSARTAATRRHIGTLTIR